MNDEFSSVAVELSKLTEADCAVILIGSAARGRRTENSDIDILFVATEKVSTIPVISGYHFKFSTEADFLRRLNAGEDFESWCLRYGVTLLDRRAWERLTASSADVWPRWEIKVVHGIRRLFLASQLSKMGDDLAAREELVFVLGHIARGLLLKKGVFPLSRPELAAQLKEIGYARLADLHERLRTAESPSGTDLALGLRYSKKLLIHLDRTTYGKIALDYAKMARSKDAKRAQMSAARNGNVYDSVR
ncbi:MAG: nucleotidyltransferase domain-containing protein [Bryobacteraceae bacterium]